MRSATGKAGNANQTHSGMMRGHNTVISQTVLDQIGRGGWVGCDS